MSKLMTNHEIISDKTRNPVTSTEYIKHGEKWLAAELTEISANKADKSYVDTELAKKANTTEVNASLAEKATKTELESTNSAVSSNTSGIAALNTDVDALSARMDTFTNLTEGSTTGDAELADGRVGADGKTYPNIGGAIRGQVGDLKEDINDIFYGKYVISKVLVIGGLEEQYKTNHSQCHDEEVHYSDGNLVINVTDDAYVMIFYCDSNGELSGTKSGWIKNASYTISHGYFKLLYANKTITNISISELDTLRKECSVYVDLINNDLKLNSSVCTFENHVDTTNFDDIIPNLDDAHNNSVYIFHGVSAESEHPINFPDYHINNTDFNPSLKRAVLKTYTTSDNMTLQEFCGHKFYAYRTKWNNVWYDWLCTDYRTAVSTNDKLVVTDNYETILPDLNAAKPNTIYILHKVDSTTAHPDNFPEDYVFYNSSDVGSYRCYFRDYRTNDKLAYQEIIAPHYYASRTFYNGLWTSWISSSRNIPASRTVYVSKSKTGKGYYNTFKDACEDAISDYGTNVIVLDGVYDLVSEFGEEYLDSLTESPVEPGGFGVKVGNGMNIKFRNGAELVFNYTGNNVITQKYFAPIHVTHSAPDFSIEGAKITAINCRYCIHMEAHSYPDYYKQSVKNCKLIHDNRTGTEVYTYACIGVGSGIMSDLIIENNYCKSYPYKRDNFDFSDPEKSEVILTHTSGGGTTELNQSIKNNYVDGGTIILFGYNDVKPTLAIVTGNRLNAEPILTKVSGGSANLIDFCSWNNTVVPYSAN